MRNKITFEEYDILVDRLGELEVSPSDFAEDYGDTYFPSIKEITEKLDPVRDMEFIIWLLECQKGEALTDEQRIARKELQKIAYEQLTITD